MNKRERMTAAFEGRPTDCIPAGFWHHYSQRDAKELIDAHVDFYKATDMDFIKIMYEFMFDMPLQIQKASDWYKLKPMGKNAPQYQKQVEIIKGILDKTNGDAMAFTTMFNPMKMVAWCVGDDGLMEHAAQDPKAVQSALAVFSEVLTEWANGYIDAGVDGIFYSAQFGEVGRFNKQEWSELVKPHDLQVLSSIKARQKYIMLHLCGEPDYDFKVHIDRYAGYPMDMVNWAVTANAYELERGQDLFLCPVMGGLDNRGIMLNGTCEQIGAAIDCLADKHKNKGFVLGADCSIQGSYDVQLMAYAVQKAHSMKF